MYWYSNKLNKKFYYKIPALKEASDLEFRINDAYDEYNWKLEPSEDWQAILRYRAQELRDTYKYLRLWYSGGFDSQTILNTFVNNKIHLDEIAILRQSPVNDFEGPECKEANDVAIPQIKKIQNNIHKTKIKIYDIGYQEYKIYYDTFDVNTTNAFDFRAVFSTNIHKFLPNINHLENLINIDGVEKPEVYVDNIGFYWRYSDSTVLCYVTQKNKDILVDHFFLDPKIHCKQCYMIYNAYLEKKVDLKSRESISNVCRDPLFINFSYGKATRTTIPPKMKISMEKALQHPEAKNLVEIYLNAINNTGLDPIHFTNKIPLLGFNAIHTKKYYLD